MANYGVQLFNTSGKLFFDTNLADNFLTLYRRQDVTVPRSGTLDLGISTSKKCIVFSRQHNGGHGIAVLYGGGSTWQVHLRTSGNNDPLRLYIFTDIPVASPTNLQYGAQFWDSKGQLIMHNNSKPLSCDVYTKNENKDITLPYQAACTSTFAGAFPIQQQMIIGELYPIARGNIITDESIAIRPGQVSKSYINPQILTIDVSKYD